MKPKPRPNIILITTLIVNALLLSSYGKADWLPIGGSLNINTHSDTRYPSICVDNTTLYVAWCEGDPDRIYVKKYNGAGWLQVGNTCLNVDVNADVLGVWPQITVASGVPYVVWQEQGKSPPVGGGRVYVKKYNGSDWELVGNRSLNNIEAAPEFAGGASIVIYNNTPYVAFNEQLDIYIKYFNGSAWQHVSSTEPKLNTSIYMSQEATQCFVTANGTPYVAWRETNGEILVKYFNGSQWLYKGGSIETDYQGRDEEFKPGLVNFNGTPYLAWNEESGGPFFQVNACYLNNGNWNLLGSRINDNPEKESKYARMVIGNGMPYVCWYEMGSSRYQVNVKYFNGSQWRTVSENAKSLNLNPNNNAVYPDMAMSTTGDLYTAWSEFNPKSQIYVKIYASPSFTPTFTITPTVTITPTITKTATVSPTLTYTPTVTPSMTITPTMTRTPTVWITSTCTTTPTRMPLLSTYGGYAKPNPFSPNRGTGRTWFVFEQTGNTSTYKISIYNLRGHLQRTLINTREWDGRSDAGHLCEGGVYIYQIEVEGRRVNGKVVLIK